MAPLSAVAPTGLHQPRQTSYEASYATSLSGFGVSSEQGHDTFRKDTRTTTLDVVLFSAVAVSSGEYRTARSRYVVVVVHARRVGIDTGVPIHPTLVVPLVGVIAITVAAVPAIIALVACHGSTGHRCVMTRKLRTRTQAHFVQARMAGIDCSPFCKKRLLDTKRCSGESHPHRPSRCHGQ